MVYGRFRERGYGEGQKLAVTITVHNLLQKSKRRRSDVRSQLGIISSLSQTCALAGSPGYKCPAIEPLHSHCGGAPCWQRGAGTPRSALVGTAV